MDAGFAMGLHDNDGDVYDDGLYIFLSANGDDKIAIRLKDRAELDALILSLQSVSTEIAEMSP